MKYPATLMMIKNSTRAVIYPKPVYMGGINSWKIRRRMIKRIRVIIPAAMSRVRGSMVCILGGR
jgi:hypothetical protein